MLKNFRDIGLVLSLIVNFFILKDVRKLSALQANYESISSNVELLLKKSSPSSDSQATKNLTASAQSASGSNLSDANIMSLIKKSVNEEMTSLASKSGSFDKQPGAASLKQLQDRIDDFQKKFGEKLSLKGGLGGADSEKLKAIADKLKVEVLNQCKK